MKPSKIHIGQAFKRYRRSRNIAQKVVAIDGNFSTQYLSWFENKCAWARLATIAKFTKLLGVPVEHLLILAINPKKTPCPKEFKSIQNKIIQSYEN